MPFLFSIGAVFVLLGWRLLWSIRPLPAEPACAAARLLFLDVERYGTRRTESRQEVEAVVTDLRRCVFTAYDIAWHRALVGATDRSGALVCLTGAVAVFELRCWMLGAVMMGPLPRGAERAVSRRLIAAAVRVVAMSRSMDFPIQTA